MMKSKQATFVNKLMEITHCARFFENGSATLESSTNEKVIEFDLKKIYQTK